jgi:hypothetical protein
MESIGRTVPSFRMALEGEVANWTEFRGSLGASVQRDDIEFDKKCLSGIRPKSKSKPSNACFP